ncbi:MAG: DMT family transporter [Candidatus Omnitrophica bacterium]|nr:DMT family transporter [bacterium]MBK7494847.1 DMT family transporter [Candidatus Omnitrophota bacterium]MCE7908507.1 DMT family transporter [Candidatus Omnitrophica bacterium COP1]MBV6481503.1 hypothetical protein [bacterium]MCC6733389.1 DMT family transporter [Candidatus Omnitrophota bacterium]
MKGFRADLFFALLAVLLWSSVATAFKIALEGLTPLHLLLLASWTSCISLAAIITCEKSWPALFHQTRAQWFHSLLQGFLNPFLYYQLLFNAYRILPGQIAQPLNYSWPILFSLFSVLLLGKKLTWRIICGLLVSFSGVVWLASQGATSAVDGNPVAGCLFALGSAAVWSLFWVFNLKDQRPTVHKLFSCFAFGTILITGSAIGTGGLPELSLRPVLASVYIGLFEMGVTFVLWLKALETSKQKHLITNLAYLSPFISLIFLHQVVGETITRASVTGLVLVVAGIGIQARE